MPNLDTNANWWNPDIKSIGLPSVNPTTTKQILLAAVAGQHIVLTGFNMNNKHTSASIWVNIEMWWGTAVTWALAASDERFFADFHQMSTAQPGEAGWGHLNPTVWPIGSGPVGPANKALNIRTEGQNAGGALLYNVGYYMVDSTALRPV